MDIDVSKLPTTSKYKVDKIYVTVYPLQNLHKASFAGFAKSITSRDSKGPFDILPSHENFITFFSKKLEIVTEKGEKVVFDKANGVIEVANNVVKVFLKEEVGVAHENR
jgi:F0F1-type ATP synthase epsilon subunit